MPTEHGSGPKSSQTDWEHILSQEGMPAKLPPEKLGTRVRLGNGHGQKSEADERLEDRGGHSPMCPINLGHGVSSRVDQPNDRPVEDELGI